MRKLRQKTKQNKISTLPKVIQLGSAQSGLRLAQPGPRASAANHSVIPLLEILSTQILWNPIHITLDSELG